jgi:hypothetical protein
MTTPLFQKDADLAQKYGFKQTKAFLAERDKAVADLYVQYGLKVTVDETGWTKPTVLMCVKRNHSRKMAAIRKKKSK